MADYIKIKLFAALLIFLFLVGCSGRISTHPAQKEADLDKQAELLELMQKYDDADLREKSDIMHELIENRDSAFPVLIKTLSDGSRGQKRIAASLIYNMHYKEEVDSLIELAKDEDSMTSTSAINALRNIGDEKVAPVMRDILKGKNLDDDRKISALLTLGVLGSKSDIDLIKKYLDDGSEAVQVIAASAMAALGDNSEEDLLIRIIIESKDTFAKKYAIQGLANFDTEKSKKKLEELVEKKPTWSAYAILSLEQQKYRKISQSEKLDFLSELVNSQEIKQYSEYEKSILLDWAFEELANMETKEAIEFLKTDPYNTGLYLLKARGISFCDKPYIEFKPYNEFGYFCCLDENNNNICDREEGKEELIEEKDIPLEEKAEKCETKNTAISCEDFSVYEDKIILKIRNNIGKNVDLSSIKITTGDIICSEETEERILINGETKTFTFDDCQTGEKGQKIEAEIELVYNLVGSQIIMNRFGDLIAEVG